MVEICETQPTSTTTKLTSSLSTTTTKTTTNPNDNSPMKDRNKNNKRSMMEEYMITRSCMRKLALWNTRNFKPFMTHQELEPIMTTLGFVAQPEKPTQDGVVWKEYTHPASAAFTVKGLPLPLPIPKLPCRRIDGLHVYIYCDFIDAVNFYLLMDDISKIFHIRGMSLHGAHDRAKKFRRLDDDYNCTFVYREEIPDQITYNPSPTDKDEVNADNSIHNHGSIETCRNGNDSLIGKFAELSDIIVRVQSDDC